MGEGSEDEGGGGGEGQRGAGDGQTLPFCNINVSVVSEILYNDIVFVFLTLILLYSLWQSSYWLFLLIDVQIWQGACRPGSE